MRKLLAPALTLALPLVACSAEAPAPPAANMVAANVAAVAVPVAGPPPAAPADSGARPGQGEMKTFKDWAVACDNVKRCELGSLGPDMGDFPPYTMQVARAAGPAGGFEIAVASLQQDAAIPEAILIDGRRFGVAPDGLAGAAAARIVAAMANGTALSFVDRAGTTLGRVSLAGASAALRYVDAMQGRAGTITAAVAKGTRGAETVPAAPTPPLIVAPRIEGKTATPSAAQLTAMRRIARCEERMADASVWTVKTGAVGGGATLVLLPCSAGAYNEIDALFVLKDGEVTPAEVDAPSGFEETGADSQTLVHSVVNGGIENGALTSYAKGRGLGDCGVSQSFVWDGRRLRLTDQSEMYECRGNANFLRTWVARVERR